jgi:hypothetical protein
VLSLLFRQVLIESLGLNKVKKARGVCCAMEIPITDVPARRSDLERKLLVFSGQPLRDVIILMRDTGMMIGGEAG